MTSWKLPVQGACRCGQVRMRVDAPPLLTMACHCTGCQRMTGSAFSLSAAIPTEGFAVTEGEPVIGGLHGATRHFFCPHCMSWMFTRPEGMDSFVNVRSTLLDEPAWSRPFVETMTSEKLPWASTPAAYSFQKWPPVDQYVALIEAYAGQAR
ncbi:MAG: GFA family protein [Gammaproteobacteria bacterium]|nr:GFA family protein [Gammaproteobacteria bacterium]